MRGILVVVACLAATGLAGCAEDAFLEDAEEPRAPPIERIESAQVARTAPPSMPYTAPTGIDLDLVREEGATLRLSASEEGLTCSSDVTSAAAAAPAGYRVVSSWAQCSLLVQDQVFATASWDALAGRQIVYDSIPVDNFTWSMSIGRVLENNTGLRAVTLLEVEHVQWAGPSVYMELGPYGYIEACDAPDAVEQLIGRQGVEEVIFYTWGHNGKVSSAIDLTGYDVLDITSTHGYTFDDGILRVEGDWAHDSVTETTVVIDFETEDISLGVTPFCGMLFTGEPDFIPINASIEGIAAGWAESVDLELVVLVSMLGIDT